MPAGLRDWNLTWHWLFYKFWWIKCSSSSVPAESSGHRYFQVWHLAIEICGIKREILLSNLVRTTSLKGSSRFTPLRGLKIFFSWLGYYSPPQLLMGLWDRFCDQQWSLWLKRFLSCKSLESWGTFWVNIAIWVLCSHTLFDPCWRAFWPQRVAGLSS